MSTFTGTPNAGTVNHTLFQNIQVAISSYAEERYTNVQRLSNTGIVTSVPDINVDGESFIGQMRWYQPINPVWNTPQLTDPTDGNFTTISTQLASYVKSVQTVGHQSVNIHNLVTRENEIPVMASRLADLRAQREHDAILAVLQGVAASESAAGGTLTGGITTFDAMPSSTVGMFVDLNAAGVFGTAVASSGAARKLIDDSTGAAAGERLFKAIGMAFKDYEDPYYYLLTPPEMMATIRGANLIDEDRIVDGNLEFQTIYNGKFRLLNTRANQGNFSSSAIVNPYSTKTTFVVKPGALAWQNMPIDVPVEMDRNPRAFGGSGTTQMWYRHGYVVHPMGYNWAGSTSQFANPTTMAAGSAWTRVYQPLNLGILPIFHG